MEKYKEQDWAYEGDAVQVWRESRPGRNTGIRAGLIRQIQDRVRLVRSKRNLEEQQHYTTPQISRRHIIHQ